MFEVSDASVKEIPDGEYTCYQTMLKVTNTEPVAETMRVQIGPDGMYEPNDGAIQFITFEGHQTKEIGFVSSVYCPVHYYGSLKSTTTGSSRQLEAAQCVQSDTSSVHSRNDNHSGLPLLQL